MRATPDFEDPAVAACFRAMPRQARTPLLQVRQLIFEIAARTPAVGPVDETLKWGQPAYLTPTTKSGTTIRLGSPKGGGIAVFTHCQTTLIAEFRDLFPKEFTYDGNRAVHLDSAKPIALDRLAFLVTRALTYHLKPPARPTR